MKFIELLGKKSLDIMLSELIPDATKEQARAVITVYCMLLNIEVDTIAWDYLIRDIFFTYNEWFDDMEKMDKYMSEFLV